MKSAENNSKIFDETYVGMRRVRRARQQGRAGSSKAGPSFPSFGEQSRSIGGSCQLTDFVDPMILCNEQLTSVFAIKIAVPFLSNRSRSTTQISALFPAFRLSSVLPKLSLSSLFTLGPLPSVPVTKTMTGLRLANVFPIASLFRAGGRDSSLTPMWRMYAWRSGERKRLGAGRAKTSGVESRHLALSSPP